MRFNYDAKPPFGDTFCISTENPRLLFVYEYSDKKTSDIKLAGAVDPAAKVVTASQPQSVAVTPDDFPGFTPKPEVKEGDTVKAGSPSVERQK